MTGRADIVVIGAGFAGLVAARDFGERGHHVVLLEARERAGGRAWFRTFPGTTQGVELGGAWFDAGTQAALCAEIARYGIATRPAAPYLVERWFLAGQLSDALPRDGRAGDDLARLSEAVATAAGEVATGSAAALRRHDVPISEWIAPLGLSPLARDYVYARTSTMAGAAPGEHPMLAILQLVAAGLDAASLAGNARHVFSNGTTSLAEAIAADIPGEIRFGTPATAIQQSDDGVIVTTPSGKFAARLAILATPINVIGQIAFAPPLEPARQRALAEGNACTVSKVWMLATGVPERMTAGGWDTPFCAVAAEEAMDGAQLVVAFALRGALDPNDTAALQRALRVYAPEAQVLAADWHDWTGDPWSRGGWMTEPPGWSSGGVLDLLARPHGRVLMAGADIASQHAGWIAGAIVSGREAAVLGDGVMGTTVSGSRQRP